MCQSTADTTQLESFSIVNEMRLLKNLKIYLLQLLHVFIVSRAVNGMYLVCEFVCFICKALRYNTQ